MDKEKVWVSEPQEGFVLGQIVDLTDEGALVQPLSSKFKSIQGIISNSKCNFTKKNIHKKIIGILQKKFVFISSSF